MSDLDQSSDDNLLDACLEAAFGESPDDALSLDTALRDCRRRNPGRSSSLGEDSALPQIGRYSLLREVGSGATGTVYLAWDEDLGREVAVKVLRREFRQQKTSLERFVEEAIIASRLQHPGIVPIYELDECDDGRAFIAMRLVNGQTLTQLLQSEPAETVTRLITIFQQVCQTIAFAHSQGVIHRDLKPSNIMIGEFGEVQVMDWGLAKFVSQAGTETTSLAADDESHAGTGDRTSQGAAIGTLAYCSAEQANGELSKINERSDVFGLGAILCEILTGSPAYRGEDVKRQACSGNIADAIKRLNQSGADEDLIEIAIRCMSPIPDERPNADEVVRQVDTHMNGVEERLRDAELQNTASRAHASYERKLRRITIAATLVVCLLGLTGIITWAKIQNSQRDQIEHISHDLKRKIEEASQQRVQTVASFFKNTNGDVNARLQHLENMVDTSFKHSPYMEAVFRQTLASIYLGMAEFDLALNHAERTVRVLAGKAGEDHSVTVAARQQLRRILAKHPKRERLTRRSRSPASVGPNNSDMLRFSKSYETQVLADNPVAYWKLNEAAGTRIAADSSPNGVDIKYYGTARTQSGATQFRESKDGYDLDCVTGNLNCFPGNSLSIEFWMKTRAVNDSGIVCFATPVIFNGNHREVAVHNPKNVMVTIHGHTVAFGVSLNDNRWHHVVVTKQAGTIRLFKDGRLVGQRRHEFSGPTLQRGQIQIGQLQNYGGRVADQSFAGELSHISVFDRALSAAQVRAHYNAVTGNAPDDFVATVKAIRDFAGWKRSGDSLVHNGIRVSISGDLAPDTHASIRNLSDGSVMFSFDPPTTIFRLQVTRLSNKESLTDFSLAPLRVTGTLRTRGEQYKSITGLHSTDFNVGTIVWKSAKPFRRLSFSMGFGGSVAISAFYCGE